MALDGTAKAGIATAIATIVAAVIAGAFTLLKSGSSPETPSVQVATVTLDAPVRSFGVRCPATFRYEGRIDVSGGEGDIVYRFLRQDGGPGSAIVPGDRQVVTANRPGTVVVEDQWTPTIPYGQVARTVSLEVVSPTTLRSASVTIAGLCDASYPEAPPVPPPDVLPPSG